MHILCLAQSAVDLHDLSSFRFSSGFILMQNVHIVPSHLIMGIEGVLNIPSLYFIY